MSDINVEDCMITDEGEQLKADDCPACRGRGRIEGMPERDHEGIKIEPRYCQVCGGAGRK
jgi:DnaJ-class molecular chaperone